jgi:hypothetical protein
MGGRVIGDSYRWEGEQLVTTIDGREAEVDSYRWE